MEQGVYELYQHSSIHELYIDILVTIYFGYCLLSWLLRMWGCLTTQLIFAGAYKFEVASARGEQDIHGLFKWTHGHANSIVAWLLFNAL